jgi:uncharacterized protein YraI
MKRCAHCKTENRDEAIFCTHCRRPLGVAPRKGVRASKAAHAQAAFLWLGMGAAALFAGYYLFASAPSLTPLPTSAVSGMPRAQESVTVRGCAPAMTHIRRGPGASFETIGGLPSGTCLTILGRNAEGTWVFMLSDDHQAGWVAVSALPDAGDLSQVSIRDYAGMAASSRPTLTGAELAHGAQAYLTEIASTNLPGAPFSRYVIPCFETAKRTGEYISCKMERAYCDYLPESEGSPTVCTDRPAPDQTFRVIVFEQDWSEYDGQCLLVSGLLEIMAGVLQVEALNRDQVSPCD